MKIKIYIRVDGSAKIGLGHIVRCIALAQMLKNDFLIHFFCMEIPDALSQEITRLNFGFSKILSEDVFFDILTGEETVVLDNYFFDTNYQKKIKSKNCKLVCIDDVHDKEFVADLIINHAPGVSPHDYKAQPYTQFALGLDYVLLRPLFLQQAKTTQTHLNNDTALICFGGADPKNLTQKALEIIINASMFKRVLVITGLAYKFEASLQILINAHTGIEHYKAVNDSEMLALMLQANLAIVPASGILFETMVTGCTIISGYYIDNQKTLFEKLKHTGAFISAENFGEEDIERAITEFSKSKKTPAKLIDGQSGKNVLKSFYNILVSLRRAAFDDCELIFNWANEDTVRLNAFNSNPIAFDDHKTWFTKKLNDDNCYMYILSLGGIDVGQVRFDVENQEATISYLIDKHYRGLGLGSLIIKKGIDIIRNENKVRNLKALVKPLNKASVKIFRGLNFQEKIEDYHDHGGVYHFSKTIV